MQPRKCLQDMTTGYPLVPPGRTDMLQCSSEMLVRTVYGKQAGRTRDLRAVTGLWSHCKSKTDPQRRCGIAHMTGMLPSMATCILEKTDQVVELPFVCENTWNIWSSVSGWMKSKLRAYGSRLKGRPARVTLVGVCYRPPASRAHSRWDLLQIAGSSLTITQPGSHRELQPPWRLLEE